MNIFYKHPTFGELAVTHYDGKMIGWVKIYTSKGSWTVDSKTLIFKDALI